ncbi:carboxylesterase/lipase family protein [Rhodococcus sp. IEGM 1379]|uniref:carboxylesterase/lipase family protein n=1 Tax=Rhodococcus sp. IEGM 1379 TaxID=3047086 RepID=UPI0024B7D4DA|nr:carboxylesterase/lipase family protein [Rhodococcus sp. IEGM 1379]MDI9916600.1 carboxylesterase/lipase family protein [Rhodococcus sp. IEGM 1379]
MTTTHSEMPVVETLLGPVRGSTDGSVSSWKGIRYAAAPVGPLRFRAPVPPEPWTEVYDATEFGPCELQSRVAVIPLGDNVAMDEDCLSLNVWAPAGITAKKPVMVWIHGGAYFRGASSQPVYDGTSLASNGDVVVVTINYRIGVFGFVDFSSLNSDEHTFDSNVALRDMIAALRWVQGNIASFGGDPDRVTLFGESAGGGAVTTLMTVPSARGLFHRAIAQSSPATSVYGSERGDKVAQTFLDILCGGEADLGLLRTIAAEDLVGPSDELFARIPQETPGTLAFAPIVDGDLLPDYPVRAFRRGNAHPIPLLIGTNKDESSLFRMMKSPLMPIDTEVIRAMFAEIADEHPDVELPEHSQIESAYSGLSQVNAGLGLTRDFGFRLPTLWIAEAHSHVAPTWLYRFDYAPTMLKVLKIGATHGTELPYVFGNITHSVKDITYKLGGLAAARHVSDRMQARWLAFAKANDAGWLGSDPSWPPYDTDRRSTLVIDKIDMTVADLDSEIRIAWGEKVIAFA